MKPEIFRAVKAKIATDFINIDNSKTSIIESSHRSPIYDEYHKKSKILLKSLLNVPDNFEILWLHGGKIQQYEGICLNLLGDLKKCSYIITGPESENAFQLSRKHCESKIAFNYIENDKKCDIKQNDELKTSCPFTNQKCLQNNFDPNVLIDNPKMIKYEADDSFVFYVDGDEKIGNQFFGTPFGSIISFGSFSL